MAVSNNTRYDREAARARRQETASGLTGKYATQAAANPYGNAEFTPNFWQNIGEQWFGDYSARDSFYQQQDQAADEYIAQLLDAQRQEQYNSPAAQAARERAAGLNPNLTGVGTGEQPAPSVNPDDTPPSGMTPDPGAAPQVVGAAAKLGLMVFDAPAAAFETVVSMASVIQGMQFRQSENDWMQVSNFLRLHPEMVNFVAGTEPDVDPSTAAADGVSQPAGYSNWKTNTLQPAFSTAMRNSGMSKGAQTILKNMRGQAMYDKNGKRTTAFQRAKSSMNAETLQNFAREIGIKNSPGWNEDLMQWQADSYQFVDKYRNAAEQARERLNIRLADVGLRMNDEGIVKLAVQEKKAELRSGIQQGTYEAEYYKGLDAQTGADATNQENTTRKAKSALDNFFVDLESSEEKTYQAKLQLIDKYPGIPAVMRKALIMAEHKRHSEWRANTLREKESLTNQLIDLVATGEVQNLIDSDNGK